jgi:hypothetical protein
MIGMISFESKNIISRKQNKTREVKDGQLPDG